MMPQCNELAGNQASYIEVNSAILTWRRLNLFSFAMPCISTQFQPNHPFPVKFQMVIQS